MSEPLTFKAFAAANATRCETAFHPVDAWTPTDWATAMAGECGEACNLIKKLRRLDDGPDKPYNAGVDRTALVQAIGKELADLVTYADLTAQRLGLTLGKEVRDKFNEVSARVGSTVTIP